VQSIDFGAAADISHGSSFGVDDIHGPIAPPSRRSPSSNDSRLRCIGALALLDALDENQREQAILSYRLADFVLGPGQDRKTIQPEGLKATAVVDGTAITAFGSRLPFSY
jgi:hypothetical protein